MYFFLVLWLKSQDPPEEEELEEVVVLEDVPWPLTAGSPEQTCRGPPPQTTSEVELLLANKRCYDSIGHLHVK